MVVSKALRATGCVSCRLSLLRNFTSVAGHPFRIQQVSTKSPIWTITGQRRQSSRLTSEGLERGTESQETVQIKTAGEVDLEGLKDFEELEIEGELVGETQESAVPWYLQADAPQRAAKPLSERQKIPDLPKSPPPILEPLLRQISIDLGLDDLSLLDLRALDPPPALGANLVMVIGTARSEKHLHVSADRLCRWLRSTYKLRPDADGLLGRNELKLKLRRKAKRAKLIGSAEETADDGVRTGWVCVDVGVVEGAEGAVDAVPERKDFVGFGRRTDGVRIVVQMLTEEKREEIDLEKLWGGILKRGSGGAELEGHESEARIEETIQESLPESSFAGTTMEPSKGPSSTLGQTRGFHTSARRLVPEVRSKTNNDLNLFLRHGFGDLREIEEDIMHTILAGNFEKARSDLLEHSVTTPSLQDGKWRCLLLHQLRSYLQSLPLGQAKESLGLDSDDRETTPFLECFYKTVSIFPSQAEAEARVWLCCYGRLIQHPYYNVDSLLKLFDELQLFGVKIDQAFYHDMLRGILRPTTETSYHGPSPKAVEGAMRVIQAMHDQGLPVLDEKMLLELQESIAPGLIEDVPAHTIYTDSDETLGLPSYPLSAIQERLHALMKAIDLPLFSDDTRLRLLDVYARQQNWREFFEIFRMAPCHGKPQSADMYSEMFFLVSNTQNQKACMNVLRTWFPDVVREDPPIVTSESVSEAVKACLRVADPHVEQDVTDAPEMKGEWLTMWRKCTAVANQREHL